MQAWHNLLPTLVVGLLVGVAATLLVLALYRSRPERTGWIQLRPAISHWLGLFVSSAAVGVLLHIRLFVGSARADADTQMLIVLFLAAAAGIAAIRFAAKIRQTVRTDGYWRENHLDYASKQGGRVSQQLSNVVAMQKLVGGDTVIHFADGDWLAMDTQAKGLVPLCNRIMAASVQDEAT